MGDVGLADLAALFTKEMKMGSNDHFQECDQCQEKYWDEDIPKYLKEVLVSTEPDEFQMLCPKCRKERKQNG